MKMAAVYSSNLLVKT